MHHTTHHVPKGVTALAPDRSEYLTAAGASPDAGAMKANVDKGVTALAPDRSEYLTAAGASPDASEASN